MLLNEHNSKLLFQEAGLPVPEGTMFSPADLDELSPDHPLPWFLKAQVLAGGRGKAGGILRVDKPEDLKNTSEKIFSLKIKDNDVPLIRLEPGSAFKREIYLSMAVSRPKKSVLFTIGREGGVEIENLGSDNLLVQEIKLPGGLAHHQIRAAFFHAGLEKPLFKHFHSFVTKLFNAVQDFHLLLAEINPLVITESDELLALDGKVEVDDNHVELNREMERFLQPEHYSREENVARESGLSYVHLNGYVGLMVNGAGLAMATMDLLNNSGLPAANFLDLGGGADQQRMETALSLLFGNENAQLIFINLFGGILSCAKVAKAIRAVLETRAPEKPMVVRMSGNGAEEGLAILKEMNLKDIHLADTMAKALDILNEIKPEKVTGQDFATPDLDGLSLEAPLPAKMPGETGVFPFDKDTPVLVQGITGREGQLHTDFMLKYGCKVVAGVTPFKGGQEVLGVPVYSSVREAMQNHEVFATIIFVPPAMAADAIMEAAENEVPWVICITEGIPQHQMLEVVDKLKESTTRLVGPNTPGLIVPGQTKIGIMPELPYSPGPVAVLSRSGTLTYEVSDRLTKAGIGQSVCVGIGGDPFIGTGFTDLFAMLADHEPTKAVVVLGEIGGRAEEELAGFVKATGFDKPVVSFIAGRTAPPGRRLGHAGAILEEGGHGIAGKLSIMKDAGFALCDTLEDIPEQVAKALK